MAATKVKFLSLNKELSAEIHDLIVDIHTIKIPFLRNPPSGRCPWTPYKNELIYNSFPNGGHPTEWIEFIISRILGAKGYIVNGDVNPVTPYPYVEVIDNIVNGKRLIVDHSINKHSFEKPTQTPKKITNGEELRKNILKTEIISLRKQLKEKEDELFELETKKDAINNMMIQTGFKGSEADFKQFLKSLV